MSGSLKHLPTKTKTVVRQGTVFQQRYHVSDKDKNKPKLFNASKLRKENPDLFFAIKAWVGHENSLIKNIHYAKELGIDINPQFIDDSLERFFKVWGQPQNKKGIIDNIINLNKKLSNYAPDNTNTLYRGIVSPYTTLAQYKIGNTYIFSKMSDKDKILKYAQSQFDKLTSLYEGDEFVIDHSPSSWSTDMNIATSFSNITLPKAFSSNIPKEKQQYHGALLIINNQDKHGYNISSLNDIEGNEVIVPAKHKYKLIHKITSNTKIPTFIFEPIE